MIYPSGYIHRYAVGTNYYDVPTWFEVKYFIKYMLNMWYGRIICIDIGEI